MAEQAVRRLRDDRGKCQRYVVTHAGMQPGDPDKLGEVLVKLTGMKTPPRTFVAGGDGIAAVAPMVEARLKAVHALEEFSNSTNLSA